MIDRLIHAYRAQIYDLDFKEWWRIVISKWKPLLACILFIIGIVLAVIFSIRFNLHVITYSAIIVEYIFFYFADKYIIKQFEAGLLSQTEHLEKVIKLLRTVLPDSNLNNAAQIDLLIDRLSEKIATKPPLHSLSHHIINFCKHFVLPIITFIAGAYASTIQSLEFGKVAAYAMAIIVIAAIAYTLFIYLFEITRKLTNKDHNAAMALLEDLKDIKLLYFSSSSVATK